MKKTIIIFLAAFALSSCDYLDRTPKDTISPESYFKTETDLQLFSDTFYNDLLDKSPFDEQSDHYININLSDELHGGNYRETPSSGGGWSWGVLRKINTLLGYIDNCEDEAAKVKYTAVARFFRAYFYFEKVKRFGDVPWYEVELGSSDEELYKARDSREYVMGKMLEDINYAIENLDGAVSTFRVNKWSALMLKAQFCLYEGTFRKYHGISLEGNDYNFYLTQAADAAKQIIDGNVYSLEADYLNMFAADDASAAEYILAIKFDRTLNIRNNTTAFATMPTQGCPGLTKKFVDSFLMSDGSRFTDQAGWQTMQFQQEMASRDPRLSYCTRTPGYTRIGSTDVLAPDLSCSSTGFQVVKFVMDVTLPDVNRVTMSYNDLPVYRYGETLLIYAEALAELGTLTQNDLDISVNLLRDRVGMPHMNMAEANANPDWYLSSAEYGYSNVSGSNKGVILEIRRERAVELAQEGLRWDDLMRWKEGKCIEQEMYGMYFPGPGEYDLTGDGVADICLYEGSNRPSSSVSGIVFLQIGSQEGVLLSEGSSGYVDPQQGLQHVFDEARDYYYPIPTNELQLNDKLEQNPGWPTGTTE